MRRSYSAEELLLRIRARVVVVGECHEFGRTEYATVSWHKRDYQAHRLVWELVNGPIPTGLLVMHICDNRRCIRIDHLLLGTYADNSADAVRKGRQHVGVRALSEIDVADIWRRAAVREPLARIARDFHVSASTVTSVVRRRGAYALI